MFEGYLIRERLGVGGMGVVYRARHPRLKRDVALKVLHEQWAHDPGTREAFEREAALVSGLDHPNIVQVYDRSAPDQDALWLSMRHITGGDVAALLARAPGGLPVEQVVALVTDSAHALDHAHAQGILHRDVKPANLLVENDPRHGRKAVLTDFGIARAADSATTATSIAMSLPYAAPERFTAGPVDHRADIYSLGCTMFQLFTGQVPFPRKAPIEFMTAHLTVAIPSVRIRRPDLPAFLETVVATVLAKDPVERYSSCQELVSDLLRAVTATTVVPARREQAPAAPEEDQQVIDAQREQAPAASEEDQQVIDARREQAADPRNAALMFNLGLELNERGEATEAETWYRKAADAGDTGAMNNLGLLLKERGELAGAETWFRKAINAGNASAMYNLSNTNAMYNLGLLLKERGEAAGAETWFRKAINAGSTSAMNGLGLLLKERGEAAGAETWFRKAINAGNTYALFNLGLLLKERGKVGEADEWFQKYRDAMNAPDVR